MYTFTREFDPFFILESLIFLILRAFGSRKRTKIWYEGMKLMKAMRENSCLYNSTSQFSSTNNPTSVLHPLKQIY